MLEDMRRRAVTAVQEGQKRVALHIIHCVEELLSQNPQLGHPGRVPGTRELVIPKTPFVIPYRVHNDVLQILRVYHHARRWPKRP
jgi:toxin ParE1/3/4